MWVVLKKADPQGNRRWRMVIDYCLLNEKTVGVAYPLPNITDILDQLGGSKYFTELDLAAGFHQIEVEPKDRYKTAFSTPFGHFEFIRMPFGLRNAPATFQRLMDRVFSGLQGIELFIYMDDIVIYAKSLKEHNQKLEKLVGRLKTAGLVLQPEKCHFLRKEIGYLGHTISEKLRGRCCFESGNNRGRFTDFICVYNPRECRNELHHDREGVVCYYLCN